MRNWWLDRYNLILMAFIQCSQTLRIATSSLLSHHKWYILKSDGRSVCISLVHLKILLRFVWYEILHEPIDWRNVYKKLNTVHLFCLEYNPRPVSRAPVELLAYPGLLYATHHPQSLSSFAPVAIFGDLPRAHRSTFHDSPSATASCVTRRWRCGGWLSQRIVFFLCSHTPEERV